MKPRYAIYLTLCLLLCGCVKDDRDNCIDDTDYRLYFIYYGDGTTDIFQSKIENVYLYIFDESGNYVNRLYKNSIDLLDSQSVTLDLNAGTYNIVCWSNITDLSSFVETGNHFSDYFIYGSFYQQRITGNNFDSLYYGLQHIIVPQGINGSDTVYFRSAHININVYVDGLSTAEKNSLRAVNDPRGWLVVRNIDVGYDFDMSTTYEKSELYPDWSSDESTEYLVSKFNLLRFNNDNDIIIDFYNGNGKLVYELSLSDFLAENDIDVENRNEITVPIYVKFVGVNVHVSVKEWDSEDVDPQV